MAKKTIVFVALLAVVPVALYFLWPTDESRIRKLFREGAVAVEQRKAEEVMARVSFNYRDDHGASYLLVKQFMERMLREMSDISVEYEVTRISVDGEKAEADISARVIATQGNDTGYFLGDAARPAELKFSLEKERARWLIVKASGAPYIPH